MQRVCVMINDQPPYMSMHIKMSRLLNVSLYNCRAALLESSSNNCTVLLLAGSVTQPTEPHTTQALPTTSTEKPHITYETTTQLPSKEQTTDANTDSSLGGQHGPGVAVIAGVSVSVVVLVVLAAVVVTAIVVFVMWKKQAPQSRGFSKLSVTSADKSAVAV